MKKISLILLLTLFTPTSFADFIGVTLAPRFLYQGMDFSCISDNFVTMGINLTGQVVQGKLYTAMLANSSDSLIEKMALSPEEMNAIELKKDTAGDYFVSTLPLSVRMINYVFFHQALLSGGLAGCQPVQALGTISPYGAVYRFVQKTASTLIAPLQLFRGVLRDGTPYRARLGFYQIQMNQ